MTGKELLKKYPKTVKTIVDWINTKAKEGLSEKQASVFQNVFSEAMVSSIWDNSTPRMLVEFFDSVNINLYVVPMLVEGPVKWVAMIGALRLSVHPDRVSAEKESYIAGFEKYEKES